MVKMMMTKMMMLIFNIIEYPGCISIITECPGYCIIITSAAIITVVGAAISSSITGFCMSAIT